MALPSRWSDSVDAAGSHRRRREKDRMFHDLFMGIAFIAMVATPAMVATLGGKKEMQPEPEPAPLPGRRVATSPKQPAGHVIRPHSVQYAAQANQAELHFEAPTLPVRARGMAGR